MFILLIRNSWNEYEVVFNGYDTPKFFSCESEAMDYATTMKYYPFQVIEVTI